MSLSNTRAVLKSTLEGISSVGVVNDYRRRHIDWNEIASSFVVDDKINGWMFRQLANDGSWGGRGITGFLMRKRTFQIWGLYSLKDADESGKTFEDIVEEVQNEIDAKRTLNNNVHLVEPSRLVNADEFVFSGVLCHRAEIHIIIEEKLDIL